MKSQTKLLHPVLHPLLVSSYPMYIWWSVCFTTCPDVPRCSQMWPDVLRCAHMFLDVPRWPSLHCSSLQVWDSSGTYIYPALLDHHCTALPWAVFFLTVLHNFLIAITWLTWDLVTRSLGQVVGGAFRRGHHPMTDWSTGIWICGLSLMDLMYSRYNIT